MSGQTRGRRAGGHGREYLRAACSSGWNGCAIRAVVKARTPDARFDFMVRAAASPRQIALWRKSRVLAIGCLSAFVDPLLGWRLDAGWCGLLVGMIAC